MANSQQFEDRTGKPWEEAEESKLYQLRAMEGLPYRLIGLELSRSSRSCERKFQSTDWVNKKCFDKQKSSLKDNMKKAMIESVAQVNDRKINMKNMATDILADRIEECVKALPFIPKKIYVQDKNKAKQTHSPEDVGLIISDAHIGHQHSFEETGGLSEYDISIFKKRVEFIKTATDDIVELHSKLYNLPNLHIFCPGDMVAGMNMVGQWSSTYINTSILDQSVEGADALADMIHHWLGLFDNIYFYGVYGNHGRAANKGVEKEYVNWDYLCYKFLESRLKGNERVHFVIPKAWWTLARIRNHKFLMVHGDGMKGGAKGFEAYAERMASITKESPDYLLSGHWHHAADYSASFGRVILNGSFIGGDVYSLKDLCKAARPEQKIFGIHDKRGVTWSYNLDLSCAR